MQNREGQSKKGMIRVKKRRDARGGKISFSRKRKKSMGAHLCLLDLVGLPEPVLIVLLLLVDTNDLQCLLVLLGLSDLLLLVCQLGLVSALGLVSLLGLVTVLCITGTLCPTGVLDLFRLLS